MGWYSPYTHTCITMHGVRRRSTRSNCINQPNQLKIKCLPFDNRELAHTAHFCCTLCSFFDPFSPPLFCFFSCGTPSALWVVQLCCYLYFCCRIYLHMYSHMERALRCVHTHTRKIKHQFSVRYSVEIFCRYVALYTTRWLFRFWCSIYWKKNCAFVVIVCMALEVLSACIDTNLIVMRRQKHSRQSK